MKIFTQESVIEEVASSMESNLVKNANSIQHVETSHRYQALERLAEAAGLFEKAGNIEKAAQLTDLIDSLSNTGKSRDQAIKSKITSLESAVQKLQYAYDIDTNMTDRYLLDATANKITGILANVTSTTSDIMQTVANLKSGYDATPKTLEAISSAVDVANGTLVVVAETSGLKPIFDEKQPVQEEDGLKQVFKEEAPQPKEKEHGLKEVQFAKDKNKKKKKKDTDLVEVLKHFGFGLDGSSSGDSESGESADCGDKMMSDDESEEYWEG